MSRAPRFHCGFLVRPGSAWFGVHWSDFDRRICINMLPCVTFWITLPGGRTPAAAQREAEQHAKAAVLLQQIHLAQQAILAWDAKNDPQGNQIFNRDRSVLYRQLSDLINAIPPQSPSQTQWRGH